MFIDIIKNREKFENTSKPNPIKRNSLYNNIGEKTVNKWFVIGYTIIVLTSWNRYIWAENINCMLSISWK